MKEELSDPDVTSGSFTVVSVIPRQPALTEDAYSAIQDALGVLAAQCAALEQRVLQLENRRAVFD